MFNSLIMLKAVYRFLSIGNQILLYNMESSVNFYLYDVAPFLLLNMFIMVFLTAAMARNKTNNVPLVGLYSSLLSLVFFPASWVYMAHWMAKNKTLPLPVNNN